MRGLFYRLKLKLEKCYQQITVHFALYQGMAAYRPTQPLYMEDLAAMRGFLFLFIFVKPS
jgi:hypothetical protein